MDREKIEKILQSENDFVKYQAVRTFLNENRHFTDYHFLYTMISHASDECPTVRIAFLSSFTIDQIKEIVTIETYKYGIKSEIFIGGYNRYESQILDTNSALYEFKPDVVILAVRIEEIFPEFCHSFLKLSPQYIEDRCNTIVEKFAQLISTLKKDNNSKILLNNFLYPLFLENGIYDFQNTKGQIATIDCLNQKLISLADKYTDTYIFNLNYYLYGYGAEGAFDDKMWFLAKNPFKVDFLIELGKKYSQFVKSLVGKRKKCLVLDLDNTLWGGIVGEEGINGIQLGYSYPGNVYRQIQTVIKQYSHQGVILALNSKNNLDDVKEIFDKHPDMVLKWDDFAVVRVNWKSKPENMKEIAESLNIGIDSFVFVDDSPFELEMVRQTYPEIETVQFSDDILGNVRLIKNIDSFQNLYFSETDLEKAQQYKDQRKRDQLKSSVTNIEGFYKSLQMQVEIKLCDGYALRRVAQLTQKTNQFNLTTKRYSESDIENLINSPHYKIYYLRLKDRFGDNGITGVIIIREKGNDWYIDTFLLSCRIIGRTAETAFLASVQMEAQKNKIKRIIGEYIPTRKNALVKDVYANHGFEKRDNNLWMLNVSKKIDFPVWIELI